MNKEMVLDKCDIEINNEIQKRENMQSDQIL